MKSYWDLFSFETMPVNTTTAQAEEENYKEHDEEIFSNWTDKHAELQLEQL